MTDQKWTADPAYPTLKASDHKGWWGSAGPSSVSDALICGIKLSCGRERAKTCLLEKALVSLREVSQVYPSLDQLHNKKEPTGCGPGRQNQPPPVSRTNFKSVLNLRGLPEASYDCNNPEKPMKYPELCSQHSPDKKPWLN